MRTLSNLASIALCTLILPMAATAQTEGVKRGEHLKEIKAQRTAYITSELALTPTEAQVFWPIYNAFDDEREQLKRDRPKAERGNDAPTATLSEAQALELLKERHNGAQKILDLERRYDERFVKAIGAVRTVELHRAEQDFRREVVRRYKERMGERQDGDKGSPSRR